MVRERFIANEREIVVNYDVNYTLGGLYCIVSARAHAVRTELKKKKKKLH